MRCGLILLLAFASQLEASPMTSSKMQPRIIGGKEAVPNSFPHQVILYASNEQWFCSGSIVDQNHVLTAAHCCEGNIVSHVVAGEHKLTKPSTREQKVRVVTSTIHEQYGHTGQEGTPLNDICILKLERPLQFNNWVKKVPLPEQGSPVKNRTNCTVSGWGLTETGAFSDVLLFVDVPIVESEICYKTWGGNSTNRVCAGGGAGKAHCSGDSGGPLMCNGVHTGVISGGRHPCGRPGEFRFYARTSGFVNWIHDHLDKEQTP